MFDNFVRYDDYIDFFYISTNYISVISHIHVRPNLNLGTYVWITACPFSLGPVLSDKLRIDENSKPTENRPLGLVAPQLNNYVPTTFRFIFANRNIS